MSQTTSPLSLPRQLAYAVPQVAQALSTAMIVQWLSYFYVPPARAGRALLVGAGVFATLMLAGRIVDAVADPLIGHWSDRTTSRLGRRRPFMLLGTPFLVLSFLALFFPPQTHDGLVNQVWLAVALMLFWAAFTLVIAPYSALLPEIARSSTARVRLSSICGVFMLVGMIAGAVMVGPWQSAYPHGVTIAGLRIASGIQMAAVATAASLALFYVPAIALREAPHSPAKNVPKGLFHGLGIAFRNRAFQTFVCMTALMQMALAMLIAALPYLCTRVLERQAGESGWVAPGQGEAWAGYLMGVAVVATVGAIPLVGLLQRRKGKRRALIYAACTLATLAVVLAVVPFLAEPAVGMALFCLLLGFPAAAALMLLNPVYADVVDYDERTSGVRREGLYNGAMSVVNKTTLGVASVLVVLLAGVSADGQRPLGLILLGPLAAVFPLLGVAIFRHHPIAE